MAELGVRKYQTSIEEIWHEGGPRGERPLRRACAVAVIANPFAGAYHADILPFMEMLKPLGIDLARRLVDALGGDTRAIELMAGAIIGKTGDRHGDYGMSRAATECAKYLEAPGYVLAKNGRSGTRLAVTVTNNAYYGAAISTDGKGSLTLRARANCCWPW